MARFVQRSIDVGGRNREYQVWEPDGVEGPLPTILFLHGMGESGEAGEQIGVGLPDAIRKAPERWPFLVVCPQKLDHGVLWPGYRWVLDAILADVEKVYAIDRTRLYLTGLSQGGNGTFELAKSLPWRFAAVAPVCGWADPLKAAYELMGTPTWMFHGDADAAVPVETTLAIAAWMRRFGEDPRVTIYPGVGHDSWVMAYEEEDLGTWFLSHRLK